MKLSVAGFLLIIFGIILTGSARKKYLAKQQKATPLEILQSVKERYHSHNKLEVKAHKTLHIEIGVSSINIKKHQTKRGSIYFASAPAGKMRLVNKNKSGRIMLMVISNGNIYGNTLSF